MIDYMKASPLHWPAGWKRTLAGRRVRAKFGKQRTHGTYSWSSKKALTVFDATERLLETLEKMGVHPDHVVVSTDLKLRLDGFPRSGQVEPDDPGAAVYWLTKSGEQRCIAIDRYDRIADNIAAIAATLEAMRAIDRHGGAEILERAFTGFTALPSPSQWWHVMGFETSDGLTLQEVEERYRKLAMQRHPDREGGSSDAMAELSWARDKAREQLHA